MRKILSLACCLLACAGVLFAQTRTPAYYEELNSKLYGHFNIIQKRAKTDRIISGIVLLVSGASVGTLGYFMSSGYLGFGEIGPPLGYTLIGTGVAVAGVSIARLAIPSRAERTWRRYGELPQATDKDKADLFVWGETELRSLADYYRTSRIVGAALDITLGAGSMLSYLVYPSTGYMEVTTGAICLGVGIAYLLIETPAEKEWKYYQEERAKLEK